jgi:hypothetical protein
MALCRLTDRNNGGKPVFVNPLHVVAVQPMGDYTWVWTQAITANGSSLVLTVDESPEEATRLLDGAMPRYA